ncbi:GAF domain-containing protein [Streptomyces sp. NPDC058676]|uniref:GAF domain-containing protein n=1 Tax=unclassified Streptomyces TaxID=2593676 RepID=UPI00364E3752
MTTTPTPPVATLSETVLKNARPEIAAWLAAFVERHGGFVGSVHLSEPAEDGEIVLVAAHNLPPAVVNGAAVVGIGKGMAGATAERKAPVGITDLQTDTSGVARRPACASQAKGSATLPVFAPDDPTRLLAVVGLGFAEPREFTDEEIAEYGADAATVLEAA